MFNNYLCNTYFTYLSVFIKHLVYESASEEIT